MQSSSNYYSSHIICSQTNLNLIPLVFSLEQMARLVEAMTLLPGLQTLSLSSNAKTGLWRRGDLLGEKLALLLKKSTSLKRLYISGESGASSLGNALTPLVEALGQNRSLETLSLGGNSLPGNAIKALARSLKTNRTLKALELDHNHITWKLLLIVRIGFITAVLVI